MIEPKDNRPELATFPSEAERTAILHGDGVTLLPTRTPENGSTGQRRHTTYRPTSTSTKSNVAFVALSGSGPRVVILPCKRLILRVILGASRGRIARRSSADWRSRLRGTSGSFGFSPLQWLSCSLPLLPSSKKGQPSERHRPAWADKARSASWRPNSRNTDGITLKIGARGRVEYRQLSVRRRRSEFGQHIASGNGREHAQPKKSTGRPKRSGPKGSTSLKRTVSYFARFRTDEGVCYLKSICHPKSVRSLIQAEPEPIRMCVASLRSKSGERDIPCKYLQCFKENR